jgi:hypothetical protein
MKPAFEVLDERLPLYQRFIVMGTLRGQPFQGVGRQLLMKAGIASLRAA